MTFEEQQNRNALDKIGVSRLHDMGELGDVGITGTWEPSTAGHGLSTKLAFNLIAPAGQVMELPGNPDYFEVIRQNHIDITYRALEDYSGYNEQLLVPPDIDFMTMFHSSGNAGSSAYSKPLDLKHIYGVGMMSSQTWEPYMDSSQAPNLMFTDISNLYLKYPGGAMNPFYGTSCSGPVLAGKARLVNSYFYKKLEEFMNEQQMIRFLLDFCQPLKGGWNKQTGFGIVILPDLRTINLRKYLPPKQVKFIIGNPAAIVDKTTVTLDQPPYIDPKTNRTLIPVRADAEIFGHDVAWDGLKREITISAE